MTKPAVFAFATAPPGGAVTAPSGALIAAGYAYRDKPTFDNFNFFLQQLGLWTAWTNALDATLIPMTFGTGGTIAAAIAALSNPMTTLGDLSYGGAAGALTRLPGNTSNTLEVLTSQGAAGAATAPVWTALLGSSIPVSGANAQTLDQAIPTDTGAISRDTRGRIATVNGLAITRSNGLITHFDAITVTYNCGQVSGS